MSSNPPTLMATYQLRQREFLLRITRAMTSRLDLPSLLELILRSAAEMVACPAGMILLQPEAVPLDPAVLVMPRFQVRALYNIPREALPAFAPLIDVSTLAALQHAALARTEGEPGPPDIDLSSKVKEIEEQLGTSLGQVVALPLLFENELLGVIYLFRGNYAFTQLDWHFLQGFADQAAIAVRNARLVNLLDTERTRLAAILENSADGIMILNADRQVIAINQTLASMVGTPPEDAVGRPCGAVLPLDAVTGYHLCQDDAYSGQVPPSARCEGELARPGKRIAVSVTYTPLYDDDGRLMNIIVNVHDITRFREEEEMKSTFTSIISHELKTPVALIKGYAATLARPDASWDAETARQGLQIIEEEADRLEGLIDNLLDASRIMASGLKLDLGDFDLQLLAQKVTEAYRTQTSRHRIELDFSTKLPLVWGDEERIRQVLTNLVGNAIKYSPNGGTIRIGGWVQSAELEGADSLPDDESEGDKVVMFVADQGVGIVESELPYLFDRFYRVDSSLRRTTPGAGLGLYLARAIIEAHGGRIWVTSKPGRGTTVFFTMPVGQNTPATTTTLV